METGPNGEPIVASPCIEAEDAEGEKMALTWFNTVIRCFEDPQFNHVEYTYDDGRLVGIIVDQEQMDLLFEYHYPYFSMPYVDETTFEWFMRTQTKDFETELGGFTNEGPA